MYGGRGNESIKDPGERFGSLDVLGECRCILHDGYQTFLIDSAIPQRRSFFLYKVCARSLLLLVPLLLRDIRRQLSTSCFIHRHSPAFHINC
ncbi:hypothetical protein AVEN_175379-1 [Araneus ventricosus]|uniref:Uncharacterized protein n=1 Tax=Araneus ventricosus TaxID=182803 RepID=A0A4Y2PI14_ARAVE|nr:hypothetical protein AVEN_175379-1 [Araneus ventricosus]